MKRAFVVALLCWQATADATTTYTETQTAEEVVSGPYRLDLKLGPSGGLIDAEGTQLRIISHFAMGISTGERHRLLLAFPVGLGLGAGYTTVTFMPGMEVDFRIASGMPFYVYPMMGIGMGVLNSYCRGIGRQSCDVNVAFGVRIGVGVRYVLWGRWNFLFEPLNLEFFPAGSAGYTAGFYHGVFGAGVNF